MSKTVAHMFFMDAMRLSIRLWGILLYSLRSAISKFIQWKRWHRSQQCIVRMCPRFAQSREYAWYSIHYIVSVLSVFSTSRIVWGLTFASGCSIRYDTRCEYFVCIPLGHQSAIPDNIQICESTSNDSVIKPSIQTINPACLYCDIYCRNVGLFWVPHFLHTRSSQMEHSKLNLDSSVKSTWLQSRCVQSRYSAAQFLRVARCLEAVKGIHTISLCAWSHHWWRVFFGLFGWPPSGLL